MTTRTFASRSRAVCTVRQKGVNFPSRILKILKVWLICIMPACKYVVGYVLRTWEGHIVWKPFYWNSVYRHSRRSRGSTVRQLAVGAFLDTRASCHLNPRTIRRQPFKPRKAAKLRYFDEVYYACYDLNSFHKSFFEFKQSLDRLLNSIFKLFGSISGLRCQPCNAGWKASRLVA